MKAKLMRAISWAIFPALLVGGFAIAAPGGSSGSGALTADAPPSLPPPRAGKAGGVGLVMRAPRAAAASGEVTAAAMPAPPMLIGGDGELTYSEIHLVRDGKSVVLRDDRGTIDSISSGSITITEADDSSVTIPVDPDTRVIDPPDEPGQAPQPGSVDDLKTGEHVTVQREDGQPASFIGVIRKDGERMFVPLPPPAAPDMRSGSGAHN